MDKLSKELTEDAKQRLFFVLTKASKDDFRNNKEGILKKANILYAKSFQIPSDRITYVDSLLYRFIIALPDKENFGDILTLNGWAENDLEAMTSLATPIKRAITAKGEEVNNESINKIMNEWANFDSLKISINEFVHKEKDATIQRINELIKEDCQGFMEGFQKQIKLLEGGREKIEKEKETLQARRIEYNKILNNLQREAEPGSICTKFEFIDEKIDKLYSLAEISLIRTAYLNLIDEVTIFEKDLFKDIEKKFYEYCKNYSPNDIVLKSIDFENLEHEAENVSTKMVVDKDRPEKGDLEKKGGISSPGKYKTIYPYTKKQIDFEKKRREFAAYVIREARKAKKTFEEQLKSKAESLYSLIKEELDKKIVSAKNNLAELQSQIDNKDLLIEGFKNKIRIIEG